MNCCDKGSFPTKGKATFRPNYRLKPLSEKFYSRHETTYRLIAKVPYYEEQLEKRYRFDVRRESAAPITTNQTYGWFDALADHCTDETDVFILEHKRQVIPELRAIMDAYLDLKKLHIRG